LSVYSLRQPRPSGMTPALTVLAESSDLAAT